MGSDFIEAINVNSMEQISPSGPAQNCQDNPFPQFYSAKWVYIAFSHRQVFF